MTEHVMAIQTTQLSANSVRLKFWERAVTWLILVAAIVNASGLVYMVATNWALAIHSFQTGAVPRVSSAIPLVFIAASVLLVKLNKWCLPLFVLHIVGSIGYIAYYYGLSAMPWYFPLGYIAELLVVSFSVRLLGRGVLK